MATPDKVDPIHQFHINTIVDLGNYDFTNSGLFMVLTVAVATLFLMWATSPKAVIPGRIQSIAELSYEFVAKMLKDSTGHGGMKFFPLVFSLFMFVLVSNLFGMIPGFFTVTNSGGETDRLVRASTPAAAMVEIHRSLMVDGVMRMEPVAGGVEIPAGATVEFAPGGLHLMLMHPKEPFALGSTVPMTLEFEQAGSVDVLLTVEAAGASMPQGGH